MVRVAGKEGGVGGGGGGCRNCGSGMDGFRKILR